VGKAIWGRPNSRVTRCHIFAAGDVIGREVNSQMATPVGSQDGGIAADNAFASGELRRVNHRVLPRTIFTDPQIATVGMTEDEAIAAGHDCWCNTVPMSLVPRAGAIRDTAGMIKMVADAGTEEVLGVSMVGNSAGEVIHEAAMAMRFRAKFGTLSTCSTSIPRWPRRSRLLPSHASKIRRNSPAARNNFPQVKTCRQSRTLTRDGKRAPSDRGYGMLAKPS
jgi:pyruvate/2-oxoglutarate dehydrogenase complex dihydrolipoamide dehydrogenase (E3) component